MGHNVSACAVAGIGGLENGTRVSGWNVKPDQLRPVPRNNINKETESIEDTEPGHCASTLLAVVFLTHLFFLLKHYWHYHSLSHRFTSLESRVPIG